MFGSRKKKTSDENLEYIRNTVVELGKELGQTLREGRKAGKLSNDDIPFLLDLARQEVRVAIQKVDVTVLREIIMADFEKVLADELKTAGLALDDSRPTTTH